MEEWKIDEWRRRIFEYFESIDGYAWRILLGVRVIFTTTFAIAIAVIAHVWHHW